MPISPMDIVTLSSPLPVPGTASEQIGAGMDPTPFTPRQQAVNTALTSGAGVTNPYGTGNVANPIQTPAMSGTAHLTSGGATVGGVTGMASPEAPKEIMLDGEKVDYADATGQKMAQAEQKQEDQISEFKEAFEEGTESRLGTGAETAARYYSSLSDKNNERLSKIGLDSHKMAGVTQMIQDRTKMGSARAVKRKDRKADKKARKEAGLTGKEKRLMRKAQRDARKDAWKSFKGDIELDAELNML